MKKIGIFGTCRIDNYEILDFKKNNNTYPFIFSNGNYSIFIRPLGYTTTTSDIFQNLNLIKNNIHKEIKDEFIIKNVFKKHGGKTFITDIDYDYLVLEICSLKKIIHLETNYIFPYEIEEDKFDNKKYKIETESFDETVQNIIKIRELINCPIILLPPIIKFEGNVIKGIHENNDKVMEYRNEIINRLKKASDNENIFLFDWNKIIDEKGIKYMLLDQFHFTIHGKKIISEQIFNIIKSKKVYFNNEKVNINLPHDIDNRHRYYKMFEQRDNCEINFRLLINYLYEKKILDYNKNIIDLGAWIGDNAIPWSFKINGNIYAIDPSLDNINFIKELIYLNNIHNIICINKCISDKIEDVFASGDLKHTSFNNETGNIKISSTSLDELYKNGIIDDVNFIHLDVEGFEHKVLKGSQKIIEDFKPLIIWEEHLETNKYLEITTFLKKFNYNTYLINEFFPHCKSSCRNFMSFGDNLKIDIDEINKLFINNVNKADNTYNFLIYV